MTTYDEWMASKWSKVVWVTSCSVSLNDLRRHVSMNNLVLDHYTELRGDVPSGIQAELADSIVDRMVNVMSHTVVVTLMELPLLRLLRQVREGHIGGRQVDVIVLSKDLTPHTLRVDNTGEFVDVWPEGFFEERAKELF